MVGACVSGGREGKMRKRPCPICTEEILLAVRNAPFAVRKSSFNKLPFAVSKKAPLRIG